MRYNRIRCIFINQNLDIYISVGTLITLSEVRQEARDRIKSMIPQYQIIILRGCQDVQL